MNKKLTTTQLKSAASDILNWDLSGTGKMFDESMISSVFTMSNDVEEDRRKRNIGVMSGSAMGIIGGGMSIAGMVLAPFTFGTSLSLTIAGAGVGIVGSGVSSGFSLHKYYQDKQRREFIQIETVDKMQQTLAKIVIITHRLSVYADIYYDKILIANKPIRHANIPVRLQIGNGIHSNPEIVIEKVLQVATNILKEVEDIITDNNRTHAKLPQRITPNIDPSSELLNNSIQYIYDSGLQEGRNIGALILVFLTEQFINDSYGTNITEIYKKASKVISIAMSGRSIYKKVDTAVTAASALKSVSLLVNVADDAASVAKAASAAEGLTATFSVANAASSATRNVGKAAFDAAEVAEDIASAGTAAIQVTRGISKFGIGLGVIGIGFDAYSLNYHYKDHTSNEKEELSKNLHKIATLMTLSNTITMST